MLFNSNRQLQNDILKFLKEHQDNKYTVNMLAEELNMSVRRMQSAFKGVLNSGLLYGNGYTFKYKTQQDIDNIKKGYVI